MPRASQHIVSDDEFEDDDLDELDESDNEEVSKTQTAAKKNHLLFGALQKPRNVTLNCKQLYELMHHGNINLNPEYQRDVVWPGSKQMGLIQSLFLNYYVPPIIFALHIREEDGVEIRTAIDGKQRCTSIQYFIDGRIPYIAPDRTRYWYRIPPGAKGKLLPEAMRRRFDMISIMVVEYDNVADDVQRDIFQRVQMGVALTSAEKLQAIAGPYTTWLSELLKKYVFHPGTLGDSFTWDTTRGKPFQTFASIAIWCQDPDAITNLSPGKYKAFLDRQDPPDDGFRKRFEKAISLLIRMAHEYFDEVFDMGVVNGRSSKIVSPVELWFMGYIVYSRMGLSSLRGLAQTCRDLRQFARQKEKDLFTNKKTITLLRAWLQGQAIAKPGKDEVVAAVEWEHHDDPSDMRQASKKRRREERELEDDPDYQGGPVARGTKSHAAEHTRSRRATRGNADDGSVATPSSKTTRTSAAPASTSPEAKTSASVPDSANTASTPRVKTEPGLETTANPPTSAPVAPRSAIPPPPQQSRWANTASRPPPVGMDAQLGGPQAGPNFAQLSPSMQAAQAPMQHSPYGATGFDPRRANGYSSQQPQLVHQQYQPQQQQQYQQGYQHSAQSQYLPQTYGSQYGHQGWSGGR